MKNKRGASLNDSAELFKLLVNSIKDYAIFMIDPKGNIVNWNKGAEQIKGYRADEVIGKNISIFYTLEEVDANIPAQNLNRALTNGTYESMGWRVRKDGSKFWADVVFTALFDDDGQLRGYAKVTRDLTLQKEAEERERNANNALHEKIELQLQKSHKDLSDYKYALDESAIVAITDQKGIIKYVNNNFCKISKYKAEELIGQDHRIINSGYHTKEFIKNLWVTIANGNIWRGELKNRAKDGMFYWVDTTIIPFLNDKGKPYQYIAIRADITERKLAQENLKVLNETLEKKVDERTAQLEAANKELESFSYSVSHDLRAPLRAIAGYSSIIEEEYANALDKEGIRLLNEVKNNAQKMGFLIDSLLAFSRLGKKAVRKAKIDMNLVVETVLKDINVGLNHKADIRVNELLPVYADYTLMQHVFSNLLSNAIKYSAKKEAPIIEISSRREGGGVIYSVTDNGAGFEMDYAHKLFGVFQRLHSSDEFEGNGVGLAIVSRIINKHGGRIWAVGEVNKGATFNFLLPDGKLTKTNDNNEQPSN